MIIIVKDSRSRKWQITINNPLDKGYTHEKIKEQLSLFNSMIYYCISDEIGEKGTYHVHVFFCLNGATRFSTVKSRFEGAHFEIAKGTCQQNRDYVFKEGKWESDKKKETNLLDTHEEFGEMPIERQGARNDLVDLCDMVSSGMTNYEILQENANFAFSLDKIDVLRACFLREKFKNIFRELTVTYLFGEGQVGKSRAVMERFGYSNVYRVTDYKHPFDNYDCQDVIIFEEFRGNLKINDMLNFLDGYPLELPSRYSNKIACYTKVFLITNINFFQQYVSVRNEFPETFNAFARRFTGGIWEMYKDYDDNIYISSHTDSFKDEKFYKTINCLTAPVTNAGEHEVVQVPLSALKEIKSIDNSITPVNKQVDWEDL